MYMSLRNFKILGIEARCPVEVEYARESQERENLCIAHKLVTISERGVT